ncbi:MAG TPA: universal stress protein [Gemmatimonadales bacterium]
MIPLRSVLVATDFTPGATLALSRAARLPLGGRAVITVLHVLPERLGPAPAPRAVAAARHALEEATRAVAGEVPRNRGITVRWALLRGNPVEGILRCGRRLKVDVVVLGRHGRRTFRELLLGSTVERVIRRADRPILIVGTGRGPYRRPLVAVDVSPAARRVVDVTLRLAAPPARVLRVVHMCEMPYDGVLLRVTTARSVIAYRRECVASARDRLARILARTPLPITLTIRGGDPRRGILAVARRHGADLIALGHGRPGLRHVMIGSVAEGVARAATCDVLVTRL